MQGVSRPAGRLRQGWAQLAARAAMRSHSPLCWVMSCCAPNTIARSTAGLSATVLRKPRGVAQVGQSAGRRREVESLRADIEQDADRPPVERQRDRGTDGAAMTVRFGEHVDRLALRGDGSFALRLPRVLGTGPRRRRSWSGRHVPGQRHRPPRPSTGARRDRPPCAGAVDHARMTTVEQAEEVDGIGEVAHRFGAARQGARTDVRMRAGAVAGNQRDRAFRRRRRVCALGWVDGLNA